MTRSQQHAELLRQSKRDGLLRDANMVIYYLLKEREDDLTDWEQGFLACAQSFRLNKNQWFIVAGIVKRLEVDPELIRDLDPLGLLVQPGARWSTW